MTPTKRAKTIISTVSAAIAAAAAASAAVYALWIRPWHLRWGAEENELTRPLPGDELVPNPGIRATHAVTIQAPPAAVWPWIVQLGQGRAGFYSYDWIENMMGLGIHSADNILPDYQSLQAGDIIPLAQDGFGLPVVACNPPEHLVLGGRMDASSEMVVSPLGGNPEAYLESGWTFFLIPQGDNETRLLERIQLGWNPSLANTIIYRLFLEPGSFIMERKMLLGIKDRAERAAAQREASP